MKNKSVLVISNNCFSRISNIGRTLESIFDGINKNNISQLYFTDKTSPDFDFCNNYYRILDINVLNNIISKKKTNCCEVNNQTFATGAESSNKSSRFLNYAKSQQSLLRICRDILWSTNSWKTTELRNWSKEQNPDFIFFVAGGSNFSHQIAKYLSETLNVPLVSFFTDDYLIYPKKRNLFDIIQYYRMKKFIKSTVTKSSLCFAIGDIMCDTYSKYFRKDFFPVMNSVNVIEYIEPPINKTLLISYFGNVHTNRWKMIIKLAQIINSYCPIEFSINVYTPFAISKEIIHNFHKSGINYKGKIFGEDMLSAMRQSDILLHVENDDPYSKSLTKLSVSTKIPEYLITGRAILGFGPKEVASMQILLSNEIGVCISQEDNIQLISKSLKDVFNYNFRKKIGKKGYDYAVNNFDKKVISKNFQNKINETINEFNF